MEDLDLVTTLNDVFGVENVIVVDSTSTVSALDQLNAFVERRKKAEEDASSKDAV